MINQNGIKWKISTSKYDPNKDIAMYKQYNIHTGRRK